VTTWLIDCGKVGNTRHHRQKFLQQFISGGRSSNAIEIQLLEYGLFVPL
jgi:hypothetical protein